MLDIESWLPLWSRAVLDEFGDRVRFLGIQGSRARGEAREDSDIDVVTVLDQLGPEDIVRLRGALAALPEREKLCGFVSGEAELRAWDASELFQFTLDTRPVYGSLDFLPPPSREAALGSARTGACALYHGCAHFLLHGGDEGVTGALEKTAFFTMRALAWLDSCRFPGSRAELPEKYREVLVSGPEGLFGWASDVIKNVF